MHTRWKLVLIVMIMIHSVGNACSSSEKKIRMPAVAGAFYPADADTLRETVVSFLSEASSAEADKEVQAVIVPHAGYVYSGNVASEAIKAIPSDAVYKRIFLLGPSHRAAFDGASVNDAFDSYATPLGQVKVDREVCEALKHADPVFTYVPEAHAREHCLEVQLPFLQVHLQHVPPIVPVIIGTQDLAKLRRIAQALQPYFTSENLFVISSDFSHYPSYEDANRVDKATGEAIESGSLRKFLDALEKNARKGVPRLATSACGQSPIAVLLLLMEGRKDLQVRHLAYCNSGDAIYGDKDRVVGYHAFSIVKKAEADAFSLTGEERAQLLQIARKSIDYELARKTDLPYDSTKMSPALQQHCGVFVTLHKGGKLRGCIGNLIGFLPLYRLVANMAKLAAFEDPRFYPVKESEMKDIDIEISVLSPLRKIQSIDEFQLGRHGIYIIKGEHRGTFLPQVAEETGWTKEEFLGHCARDKAGLAWNGWKDAELYVYEAIVFGEEK